MGELRVRQKRNAEAEALFHRVLEIDPSSLEAQRRLGAVYQSEGKAAEAVAAQEAIVKNCASRSRCQPGVGHALRADWQVSGVGGGGGSDSSNVAPSPIFSR